jgi:dipeptidyl aminopeptidase/acylaminoacyl peptidase
MNGRRGIEADRTGGATMTERTVNDLLAPEALADRIAPSDPRIAPDGSRVAFVACPRGQAGEHSASAIWLAAAGSPARRITAGEFEDRAPRWSPDGSKLLILSDRVEKGKESGVYLLPMTGGEAERLGDLAGELRSPAWSPDGRTVALLRTDPKDDARKEREKERDDRIVVEQEPHFRRLWTIDVESGKARCLTYGAREVRHFCWLPDSSGLVMVTTELPGWDEIFSPATIWHVPARGALPRRIGGFPALTGAPVVIGDQVIVPADGQRGDPPTALWSIPLAGGEARQLATGWVGEVSGVLPAGAGIVMHGVERVHAGLYAVDTASGELQPVTPFGLHGRGTVREASFSADGRHVAFVWSDSATPEEVWLGPAGGNPAPVTTFGAAWTGNLQPGEIVRWTSDDGLEIEGLLIRPAGMTEGQRVPLVVEIHGGPSWQWEDRVMLDWHDWAQMLAGMGIAVLLPNPRGSTGYGAEFQARLQDDVGGGEARDLISGALAMVERGIADPERLGVGGWSWGGYLTARVVTMTTIFKAAVMGAGLSNMISDHGTGDIPQANLLFYPGHPYEHMDHYWMSSPIREVRKVTTPTLILHGDQDARVHPAQGAEFFRALKVLGVPVEFVRYPREGHGIGERLHQIDLMQRVAGWYRRWLLDPE